MISYIESFNALLFYPIIAGLLGVLEFVDLIFNFTFKSSYSNVISFTI